MTPELSGLIGFAVVMLLSGFRSKGSEQREVFLLADRSLGGVVSGLTITASKVGGGLLVTYSSLVFAFGSSAIWLFLGYLPGYLIFYWLAAKSFPDFAANRYYTLADVYDNLYGSGAALSVGIFSTLSLSGWIFTNFLAAGSIISELTPISNLAALCAVAVMVAAYIAYGGYDSVVRTDAVQCVAIVLVILFITLALYQPEEVYPAHKLSMPSATVMQLLLIGLFFPLGSVELWQRGFSARSRGALLTGIMIASTAFLLLGTALYWVCLSISSPDGSPPELGLVRGVAAVLPPTGRALWIVVFLAAVASSADTFLFSTSNSLVQDVFERLKICNPNNRVRAIRATCLCLAVVGVVASYGFGDVVAIAFYFAGITMALGAITLLMFVRPQWLSATSISTGLVAGLTASTVESFIFGISVRSAAVNVGVTLTCLTLHYHLRAARK